MPRPRVMAHVIFFPLFTRIVFFRGCEEHTLIWSLSRDTLSANNIVQGKANFGDRRTIIEHLSPPEPSLVLKIAKMIEF
jgi:hypothetical protein